MSAVQHQESVQGSNPSIQPPPPDPPLVVSASIIDEGSSRGVRIRDWLKTGTGIFSSSITILAATLTVVFLLVPSLRPDPPPVEFSATLSDQKIESDVALSDYYARLRIDPPQSLSAGALLKRGVIVSFTVVIEGFQDKESRLTWSVFDATTNKRSSDAWLVAQPGWPAETFTPLGNRDQANGEIYVPEPPEAGSYFVRLELNDPTGTRIATLDSPVFSVEIEPTVSAPLSLPTPGAP